MFSNGEPCWTTAGLLTASEGRPKGHVYTISNTNGQLQTSKTVHENRRLAEK